MIEEEAVVACIEAGQVWVEKTRHSACSSCVQPCMTASVADYFGKTRVRLAVTSPMELRIGDRVVLGIREDVIVKGLFGVYLLPLLGLLAGSILGKAVGFPLFSVTPDVAAAMGGVIGLIAAIAFLKHTRMLSPSRLQPVVLRKVG
jgi:sigma-E factor negative regulatory protein RseC